jgi:hypothetical protein
MSHLSAEQFQYVVRCCQRVLFHPLSCNVDLRRFLILHLAEQYPDAALNIENLSEGEMTRLREQILTALNAEKAAASWR